ncbi:MAG: cation:proton antiporter, partial [Bacteroidales bacterium]|nr:cation:proton antiporter [Bacteroidales bacterium]
MTPLSIVSGNLLSDNLLLIASILVFAAIMITKLGSRIGTPTLLLFLLLGMFAGEDGLGLEFEDYELAESIGHFAMTIILFAGGLETSLSETKPVIRQGILLSTVGVFLTAALTGV